MKIKDFDLDNPWDFAEFITQSTMEREPNETDEHYKKRLLKYMEITNEK